jgi:peptidoglycan/xylan/chitin deacetylase (PgdA/CDA1 family)
MRSRHAIRVAKDAVAMAMCQSGAVRLIESRGHRHAFAVAMYHGLVRQPLEVDEWCFLDEERFIAQMEYLVRHFDVVHLEDACNAVESRRSSRPVACVTFDDGFASVYNLAFPILQRLQIPATVYVVSGLIDTDETVWFAAIHEALSRTAAPHVDLLGVRHPLVDNEARSHASQRIQTALKQLPADEFAVEEDRVMRQLGVTVQPSHVEHLRMLTSAQIREMAGSGLVRFGGHTESHQILTRVPAELARREIQRSVVTMTELGGRPTTSFAYPNGAVDDYDDPMVEQLRQLGVQLAVTTSSGPNGCDTDLLRLRRYGVGSHTSLGTFAWRMHHGSSRLVSLRSRMGRQHARSRH